MIKGQLKFNTYITLFSINIVICFIFIIISSIIINNTKSILALLVSSESFKDFVSFLSDAMGSTGNTIREFLLVVSSIFLVLWLYGLIESIYWIATLCTNNIFINMHHDHIEFKRGIFSSIKNYKLDEIQYIRPQNRLNLGITSIKIKNVFLPKKFWISNSDEFKQQFDIFKLNKYNSENNLNKQD
ncbi:hypothetical protein [Mycoplasma zalophi]|uniref:hypothetical protein n=1 Tax=Mycoplasma zalophi TaxID=191287 RepID=UPI001C10D000|nr:hypothetical protein [Mycoplasma zalophi]MBU4691019.1 hypothetical protein [Mycoplasma zalophi]